MDLLKLSILELRKKLDTKEISSVELTQRYLNWINKDDNHEKPLNCLIHKMPEIALNMAKKADERLAKGESNPLLGIPIIIKDNINVRDVPMTCASKILDGYVSPYNATVIDKLNEQGAVFLGKSNLDEFAMGTGNENSYYGVVRNPYHRDYVPGGSSGGSASSVAAYWSPLALGSDTGGSIRQPASYCGIVGVKPTYGLVSRYGVVPFASCLDQVGPLARYVEDAAVLLEAIAGHDIKDATSSNRVIPSFTDGLEDSIHGKTIGILKECNEVIPEGSQIQKAMSNTVQILKDKGCKFKEFSIPMIKDGFKLYYIIATAEACSNLLRHDGIRYGYQGSKKTTLDDIYHSTRNEGFGSEVKRRIISGAYFLSGESYFNGYVRAQKLCAKLTHQFTELFQQVDVLLMPTSPSAAFLIADPNKSTTDMYLADLFAVHANLTGVPAISVPVHKNEIGLPIGIQVIGNWFNEAKIFNFAWHIQNAINFSGLDRKTL